MMSAPWTMWLTGRMAQRKASQQAQRLGRVQLDRAARLSGGVGVLEAGLEVAADGLVAQHVPGRLVGHRHTFLRAGQGGSVV
jgi:hypothetical protein